MFDIKYINFYFILHRMQHYLAKFKMGGTSDWAPNMKRAMLDLIDCHE